MNFITALFRKAEPTQSVRVVPLGAPPKTERDDEIVRRYLSGESSGALGASYGVSRERICQVLRRDNIIENRRVRRIAAESVLSAELEIQREQKREVLADAIAMIVGGQSAAAAAASTGLKANYILRSCRAQNIEMRHGRWRSFEERKRRIREANAAGRTLSSIIAELRAEGDVVHNGWVNQNMRDLIWVRGGNRFTKAVKPKAPPIPVRVMPDSELWTEPKVSELLHLWFLPTTAQQIADVFGAPFTRNSVIRKVYRLRLAGKLAKPEAASI